MRVRVPAFPRPAADCKLIFTYVVRVGGWEGGPARRPRSLREPLLRRGFGGGGGKGAPPPGPTHTQRRAPRRAQRARRRSRSTRGSDIVRLVRAARGTVGTMYMRVRWGSPGQWWGNVGSAALGGGVRHVSALVCGTEHLKLAVLTPPQSLAQWHSQPRASRSTCRCPARQRARRSCTGHPSSRGPPRQSCPGTLPSTRARSPQHCAST